MPYLVAVSLLWAFSFGLIKVNLSTLDSTAVSTVRLGLALLVFLPVFRPRLTGKANAIKLTAIGAVQFGLMYVLYIAAFRYLQAYEIVLFTVFTPIYVVLLDGLWTRKLAKNALSAAALALVGAAILKWRTGISNADLTGFALMQGSNLVFAFGQVAYRRVKNSSVQRADAAHFGWLYLGAVGVTALISLFTTNWPSFDPDFCQWRALIYLGIIASGLGFFGWNKGARQVNAGTLAVFNNLKIPLAVGVSLVFFGEKAELGRLAMSCVFMAGALYLTERKSKRS